MSATDFTTSIPRLIKNDRAQVLSHSDVVSQFCAAMRAAGLIVSANDIVTDSLKFQRCKSEKDKGARKNGYYKLWMDRRPAGVFGIWSTGESHTWSADTGAAPMSAEEQAKLRAEMRRKQAERAAEIKEAQNKAAERAKKIWDKAVPADDSHPYLARKGVRAHGLRVGKWWKWDADAGKPYLACDNALLVPKYGIKRDIRSLQAIFPGKIEINGEHRDKDYLGAAEKDGVFHVIGKPHEIDGRKVVIVTEGYATAASIHEATGHCVLVAFDTGNLVHTAQVFRSKYPDAVIVFAADNDQFTVAPINNPGVHYARKAAAAVGGLVAVPEFHDLSDERGEEGELIDKPTDWNDAHQRPGYGVEFVRAGVIAALEQPAPAPGQSDVLPFDGHDHYPPEERAVPRSKPATQAEAEDQAVEEAEEQAGFRILGHQRDKVFIFVHGMKQIIERETFPLTALMHMAPLNWWEKNFPGKNNGGNVNYNQAAEFIIRTAQRRGLYDPNCVRNGGAWSDAGRHVFHHGDHLTVDGARMPITAIRSRFVYEQTLPLPTPADVALTDFEGRHILDIAKRFNWERSSSAALLAGWTFISPVCGALRWRPHLFLTGPAGNGKSTILRDYVHTLIGDGGCVYAQGSSTEAGVRQGIGSTSLPCLIDEAERNTEREQQRIEALLALIRQSSTESAAKTLKGTVGGEGMKFNVRSMFCLAAIFTGLERKADIDRLSVLSLKPSRRDAAAADRWECTKELLHKLGNEDDNMRGKLLRRALDMLPTILANIEVFKKVAAEKFGSARDGDQFGTMLGGTWSLTSSTVSTPEQARAMIDELDWTGQSESTEVDDSQSALQELMGAFIQVLGTKYTVHDLISRSLGVEVEGSSLTGAQARRELRNHGVVLDASKLVIAKKSGALSKLLAGTPYHADPSVALGRMPGAEKGGQLRFNGIKQYTVLLPLESIGFGGRNIESEEVIF